MRRRKVLILPEAQADLTGLYDQIADAASEDIAFGYVENIKRFCEKLDLAGERGHRRDDIRPSLRIVGFRGRVTVAFFVNEDAVLITRIFYGGRDWEAELSDEG